MINFLGIGAQKAGTTWLHKMLALHPMLGLPPNKELHFWDTAQIDDVTVADYQQQFADMPGNIRGEITPSYAILTPERIALVKKYFPDVRLVYILRNPIDRAWSHAKMEIAKQLSKQQIGESSQEIDVWVRNHFISAASVSRGDYSTCLQNWQACFHRSQFKIYIYEEAFRSPLNFLETCCEHIGAEPAFYRTCNQAMFQNTVYPEDVILNIRRTDLPDELPQAYIEILIDLYTKSIHRVSEMLGRDLASVWLTPYRSALYAHSKKLAF
jgi:Sulfotransferase domain